MKKWITRLIVVCAAAVTFEFLFFNFSYVRTYLSGAEYNIAIAGDDLSLAGSQITLENIDRRVDSFDMFFESAPVTGVSIFYTDNDNPYFTVENMIYMPGPFEGGLTAVLNRHVNDLRIDLGGEGFVLSNVQITLNPRSLDFSLSRVVAMVIVYAAVKFLFSLQKIPTYSVE